MGIQARLTAGLRDVQASSAEFQLARQQPVLRLAHHVLIQFLWR
jgi:hypothetical protein